MKKLLLCIATVVASGATFAQSALPLNSGNSTPVLQSATEGTSFVAKKATVKNQYAKSTGLSDTLYYETSAHITKLFTDSAKLYYLGGTLPLDSGFVFGYNAPGWNGYASRFWVNYLPDTTLKVTGVLAVFSGAYSPSTTKTIDIKMWGLNSTPVTLTTTRKMTNFPGTVMATLTRSIKTIGVSNSAANDTIMEFFFPTAVTGVNSGFFVGYEATYQWGNQGGDTIGAYSCTQGMGWDHGIIENVVGTDTFINAKTAVKDAGVWKDAYMQLGFPKLNLSMVPIFHFSGANFWPSEVGGVTKDNLTFYGNYPNPATDKTNVQFSLANATSVSLMVRDITGKTVLSIPATKFEQGKNVITLETAKLAAGNYVYMISTAEGAAMAAQLTIVK